MIDITLESFCIGFLYLQKRAIALPRNKTKKKTTTTQIKKKHN